MLLVVGDLVEDVLVLLPGPPAAGTDTACEIVHRRGGSAANVAVAAREAGEPARLLARVGDDDLGDRLLLSLARAGVETAFVQRAGATGTVVVLVDTDGERSMLTDRGSSARLEPDVGALEGATAVHVPAYGLDRAEPVLEAAAERGLLRSVDASSVGLLEIAGAGRWRARLGALGPDVLFADAGEATFLRLVDEPIPGVGLAVVKDGPRPALLVADGRAPVAVPAEVVPRVLDSTGAGDAFAAGWLVATLHGADPVAATVAGHRQAARAVARVGASA